MLRKIWSRLHEEQPGRPERLLLTLPFYLLFLAQLAHHGIWRDEINAWTISAVSRSVPELLHRVHYEAHPALWYLILFAAGRISNSLFMLKAVEALIGTGTYFLIAWAAPFRRLELLLVLLSFYLTFEYTVMCRMYGLELLFALAYAIGRTRTPDRVMRNSLWLGLMANVDLTGAILGGALLLEYGVDRLSLPTVPLRERIRSAVAALLVFAAGFAIAIETLWPAKDLGWSTTGHLFSKFWSGGHLVWSCLDWISVPWVPKAINIVAEWDDNGWPYFYLAMVVLLLYYVIFRPHWRAGVLMAAVTVFGILFTQITHVAGTRHTGIVFIGFLVALWMLRFQGERVSLLVYPLLLMTAVTGGIAIADQWSWPFTDTAAAAAWMQQQHLEDVPLFGTPDTHVLGVPERLHRPFYQLECNCVDTVLTFSSRRDGYEALTDVPARLIRGFHTQHVSTGILIINRKLTVIQRKEMQAGGLDSSLIANFDRGFLGDEYVYLYRVTDSRYSQRGP